MKNTVCYEYAVLLPTLCVHVLLPPSVWVSMSVSVCLSGCGFPLRPWLSTSTPDPHSTNQDSAVYQPSSSPYSSPDCQLTLVAFALWPTIVYSVCFLWDLCLPVLRITACLEDLPSVTPRSFPAWKFTPSPIPGLPSVLLQQTLKSWIWIALSLLWSPVT